MRIATELGVLANAQVAFLPPDTPNLVTESHFIRALFLCKNPSMDTYVMIYKGYNFEVPLPAPEFKIYHVDTLFMPLESVLEEEPLEEPRHSGTEEGSPRALTEAGTGRANRRDGTYLVPYRGWHVLAHPVTRPDVASPRGSGITPWGHEPSTAFSQQQGAETFYGYGSAPYEARPSASARFAGDPLSAIFGSLTIQNQRTAGMAQQLNQVDERTQVIQQTQDE
ncbi:hypothetical protein U9M48_032108 [Paspalum notatum var. saurae]|uniref:Uncharacterized protein n=1 Tax=Paspalum notatum var. saurae TaxID=547442 RepID=A0AAQ3U4D4_PASNO